MVDHIVTNERFRFARDAKRYYPHGFHGVDKLGRPVYIERIGALSISKILKVTSLHNLFQYYVQEYEHLVDVILPSCSEKAGRPIEQTLTILDMDGLGIGHFTGQSRSIVSQLAHISQHYYPEILGRMLIINCPTIFTIMWNFVKPLLDEKTVSKISVFGSKWRDVLSDLVDSDQLPTFLGGTRPSDATWVNSDFGPWVEKPILTILRKTRPHVPPNLYLVALPMSITERDIEKLASDNGAESICVSAPDLVSDLQQESDRALCEQQSEIRRVSIS